MKVLSTWNSKEYPNQIMQIVDHPKYGLCVKDSRNGILNLMPETFIGFEKLLWGNGWRKK